jgi:hypothetical protein
MAVAILPVMFPAQVIFSLGLLGAVALYVTYQVAKTVWVFSTAVIGAGVDARRVLRRAANIQHIRARRAWMARAGGIAVMFALALLWATASEATTVIRCSDWCWWY